LRFSAGPLRHNQNNAEHNHDQHSQSFNARKPEFKFAKQADNA